MSDWQCRKGESMLIPSGPGTKMHLFAILLDPITVDSYGSQPQVLLASVESIKPGIIVDDSCLLGPGDHPFIEHDSFVNYRHTRLEAAQHIEARINDGVFVLKEPCSPELIRRIIQGAMQSRRISREFKKILENVTLV